MGFRIQTVMGYGLIDLELNDDGEIEDSRVSTKKLYNLSELPLVEYKRFLEEKIEPEAKKSYITTDLVWMHHLASVLPPLESESAWDYINVVDDQDTQAYNGKGIIIITPYGQADWKRSDDAIDHALSQQRMTESGSRDSLETEVTLLSYNPFPFNGNFVDIRTNTRLPSTEASLYSAAIDPTTSAENKENIERVIASVMGYDTHEGLIDHIRPEVPETVKHMASWTDVFTSPEVMSQLRPMVLTYWQ